MKIFTKEWALFGSHHDKKVLDYLNYEKTILPKWYNEFSVHDNQIVEVIRKENVIIFNAEYDDDKHTKYQFILYDPTIIEDCEIDNAWCLYDELYIDNDKCEYHLSVEDSNGVTSYFTVECSNIELYINGRNYRVFGESNESSIYNQSAYDEKSIIEDQLKKIDGLIQTGDKNTQEFLKSIRDELETYMNTLKES